ncbi:MAG: MBL fold metallo-hydrolase [Armatimonadetes bacterium]|nr:MBL fold metallo-hydrolase [Armatimonadota bacterium]
MATAVLRMTVLCDNGVARCGASGVHGLAVLVETPDRRLLFDTGPDTTVATNADVLEVSLAPLDAIVLSHGHYDHIGGLETVLGAVGPTPVIAPHHLFSANHHYKRNSVTRYIGPPRSEESYRRLGAEFMAPDEAGVDRLLGSGFTTTVVSDELALIGLIPGHSVVLTGCAHGGAATVVREARDVAKGDPPRVLVGGLHLGDTPDSAVHRLALRLHALGIRTILPCHCTGPQGTLALKERFLGDVCTIGSGSVLEFSSDGAMQAS